MISHFNMYSFECIERLSYFYSYICDKNLPKIKTLKKRAKDYRKSCSFSLQTVLMSLR